MNYLLDTNVCIEAIRGNATVIRNLKAHSPDDCFLSTISLFELESGALYSRRPKIELERIQILVDTLLLKTFDRTACSEAAAVRSHLERTGKRIGAYDTLLAGHALALGVPLVTNNIREFARVPNLVLENWERS